MGFLGSSGKTSHNISHSRSISTIFFCRLAWKEEVVKVIGAQCVGRSVIVEWSMDLQPSVGLAVKS